MTNIKSTSSVILDALQKAHAFHHHIGHELSGNALHLHDHDLDIRASVALNAVEQVSDLCSQRFEAIEYGTFLQMKRDEYREYVEELLSLSTEADELEEKYLISLELEAAATS